MGWLGRGLEYDPEDRAAPRFKGDLPVELIDDQLGDRETEAGPAAITTAAIT